MSDASLPIEDGSCLLECGPVAVFPELQWRVRDVLIGFVPNIAFRVALPFLHDDVLAWVELPANLFGFGWMLFYPIVVARSRAANFRWPPIGQWTYQAMLAVPTLLTIWIGIAIVFAPIRWLVPDLGSYTNPLSEPAADSFDTILFWTMILAAVMAAPIAEELFFRGMIYGCLKQYIDFRAAAVIQGFLFGFMHTFGMLHAIVASFLGIAFALVYERRKTIVAPICVHCLQNSSAATFAIVAGMAIANGPYLGVFGTTHAKGCEVTRVSPDSGAAEAGIQEGDIIFNLSGTPIFDFEGLKQAIRERQVGDHITIHFYRDDEPHNVLVELKKRIQKVEE